MSRQANTSSRIPAEMAPLARAYYEREFLPRLRKLEQEIAATPLVVLVWGPGQGAGDLYEKRHQMRDLLRANGDAAVFSEEIDASSSTVQRSAKVRELLQAVAADFIVLIQGSPGSTAEAHDFAHFLTQIGSKMLIFIDSRYVNGYSYMGALAELKILYNNVEEYKYPEDIRDCHLLAAVQSRLDVLRAAKWRISNVT